MRALEWLSALLIFLLGVGLLALLVMFVIDVLQTKDAVCRNFPVIGRFRGLFERLGDFFRQYFFALDREEMPFNRAQREWVYRAGAGVDETVPFGSTLNLTWPGTPIFVNCAFPMLESEMPPAHPLRIGPYARRPYDAPSFFNVSGMSYGALSKPAIQALSHGSKLAGNWLNTGEGRLGRMAPRRRLRSRVPDRYGEVRRA